MLVKLRNKTFHNKRYFLYTLEDVYSSLRQATPLRKVKTNFGLKKD